MTDDEMIQFFCQAACGFYPLSRLQEYETARQMLLRLVMNDTAQRNIAAAKAGSVSDASQ